MCSLHFSLFFLEFCHVFLTYSSISSTKLMLWTYFVLNYQDNSSVVLWKKKKKKMDNRTKDDIHEFHTTVLFRVHVTFSFRYVFTVSTQILAILTPVLVLSTSNYKTITVEWYHWEVSLCNLSSICQQGSVYAQVFTRPLCFHTVNCALQCFCVIEIFQHVCYRSTMVINIVSSATLMLFEYCVLDIDKIV
jgi:hypothetical protein